MFTVSGSPARENFDAIVEFDGESSLEDRSGCLGVWLLSYLTPLLKLGSHKVLDPSDIGVPSKQDEAENAYEKALEAWNVQSRKCHEHNAKLKAAYLAKLITTPAIQLLVRRYAADVDPTGREGPVR